MKISVAELRSAGRSIGMVMLRRTRSGAAPALRAASSSDESARTSAAWQVRKAIGISRVASTIAMPKIVSIAGTPTCSRWLKKLVM